MFKEKIWPKHGQEWLHIAQHSVSLRNSVLPTDTWTVWEKGDGWAQGFVHAEWYLSLPVSLLFSEKKKEEMLSFSHYTSTSGINHFGEYKFRSSEIKLCSQTEFGSVGTWWHKEGSEKNQVNVIATWMLTFFARLLAAILFTTLQHDVLLISITECICMKNCSFTYFVLIQCSSGGVRSFSLSSAHIWVVSAETYQTLLVAGACFCSYRTAQ